MNRQLTVILLAIIGTACGRVPDPQLLLHDTKYSGFGDAPYECVLDSDTALYWEVKSNEPGLHDWRHTYTWFDPGGSNDELDYRGTEDGGVCAGSPCDTAQYVQAVNAVGYCGFSDWRVPGKNELFSVSDLRKHENPPTMKVEYFPFAQAAEYWSVNDYSFQHNAAWVWSFEFGHDRVDWKASPKFLRLVRGEPADLTPVKE
jgi:hypothetical protein